jgi:hypothetical protein
MANSKISALTSASTVVGTEVLPIVQSSATVKVSVGNLTPGLNTITAAKGGTGQTSYAVGDLLYADTTTTLAKLADVATGNALISGGVSTAPSYGKIGLTTHVSGTLPVANGGTNAATASITSFNNITGYTASGATGTTTTNLVFSTSPSVTTPTWIGNATLSTGNIIQGTAAKGFDFSANTPAAGKTSTVLNWYEEGTWTPVVADATSGGNVATVGTTAARYTRIGRTVFVQASLDNINTTGMTAINNVSIRGLPFANAAGLTATGTCVMNRVSYAFNSWRPQIDPSLSLVQFTEFSAVNANYTTMTVANILATTSDIYFSITYTI